MTVQLPTNGLVKQVKLLKTVPGKNGKPDAKVWKVRLGVGDQFIDAELFGGDEPAVGTELSVEASEYGPKAKRLGAFRGGGGRRGNSPEDRASIESQVAAKVVTELAVHEKARPEEREALTKWILEKLS